MVLERPTLYFYLLLVALLVFVLGRGGWRFASSVPTLLGKTGYLVAWLGSLVFVVLVGHNVVWRHTNAGLWRCNVCRTVRQQVHFLPPARPAEVARLWSGRPPDEQHPAVRAARTYETWFRNEVAVEHEHRWERVGGHRYGTGVMCAANDPGSVFLDALRLVQDREIRRRLVERWIAFESREIRILETTAPPPGFIALRRGERVDEARLIDEVDSWLASGYDGF